VRDEDFSSEDTSDKNEGFEEAWFLFLTAANVGGHKEARAYLALMLENGMIPSSQVFSEYAGNGEKYEYL
jgi:hypothetical protein